ncbi:phosphate/phosphite/phosphonate ABC transporter substrate-binding protein [Oceanidesulfovibrio indonesiensis]|nr:phosphate/phosphite/phosphonate ABC transporter substrate-binding protein [Oceanidesulfovibrio indonesiensis]
MTQKYSNFLPPFRCALLLLAVLLLLACGVYGCSDLPGEMDDTPVRKVDLDNRREILIPSPEEAVTYAYLPQYSHTTSYARHRLLTEYLSRETGLNIRQVFPDTFEEHVAMVARGEIDISYSNPMVYLRLADMGAYAFARVVEASGKPSFRGQIIARADNEEIRTLRDCVGKRWIAVDPDSAGGFLFVLGHFMMNGILPGDFKSIDFAPGPGGKQEKVAMSVYAGTYDFGSIREGTLDVVADKIDISRLRIVDQTRSYPGWVYAARKDLDPDVVDKIANAMFSLDKSKAQDALILGAADIENIIPAQDEDYEPTRELRIRLGQLAFDATD